MSGAEEVAITEMFVVVAAISAIGLGLNGTVSGALVCAGDTRWPFVVSLIGRYVFTHPVAIIGLVTLLGVAGLYLAVILESFVSGSINYRLFKSG